MKRKDISSFLTLFDLKPNHFARLCLRLQFKCCGSNHSHDWMASVYISTGPAEGRVVPDSCCKTITPRCGKRDHPSNIYKVEVSALGASGKQMLNNVHLIGFKLSFLKQIQN